MVRICSFIFRFVRKARAGRNSPIQTKWVSTEEIQRAENYLIREIQKKEFQSEYIALLGGKPLFRKRKLLSLNPFLDEFKVMRVEAGPSR